MYVVKRLTETTGMYQNRIEIKRSSKQWLITSSKTHLRSQVIDWTELATT